MISTRTKIAAGSTSLLAVAAAVTVPALLGSATAATTANEFTVRALNGAQTTIDAGRKGFSAGDDDLGTMHLRRSGKSVGWGIIDCLTVHVGPSHAVQQCTIALHFGKGQIVATGAVRSGQQGPGTFSLAITGGTGRYRNAQGQMLVTATSGNSIPITVQLTD
jgi:hypothetical protein